MIRALNMFRSRASAAQSMLRTGSNAAMQKRFLSIHEYLSMGVLNKYGIDTPKFVPASTPEEAFEAAKSFGGKPIVIKAQVLAGGRGKGHFDNGLQGGVHLIKTPEEARDLASKMLGAKLITKQTGSQGRICNKVMIAEARKPAHEYYVAVLNDRVRQVPVLIASNQGGMSIEDVAKENPDAIITTPIPLEGGLDTSTAMEVARKLGFSASTQEKQAAETFVKLYKLFDEHDATQVEINPLAESEDGAVLCMDAKLGFDDNADFRQKEIFDMRDVSQEDPSEVQAGKYGLNFIKLEGNIGCLVNGAGLAMATLDVLSLNGGKPANFLDVGGGANTEAVKQAFEILLASKDVRAIFVNIFGGIMRCDVIAEGIVEATKQLDMKIPLVVRLQGTKEAEAKALIKESGLKIQAFDDLDIAAKKAVEAAH
ncbi:succinate--CoA ligase beta chain [Malassezia pachydermatis]|uniref:Succinate--CoA ligase [ADP-forming] subunit beta, mitochondrial n=1 Tax=Malassezia pachydermatis TaxID=77020 RepID=A0A0M9VN10_9BASI|nr:succinate- ligase [Malassezia pachydermatis]KOS12862.1 succinate- ligase [Malassezia pachydermatis]